LQDANDCLLRSQFFSRASSPKALVCPACLPTRCSNPPPMAYFLVDSPLFLAASHNKASIGRAVEDVHQDVMSTADWISLYKNERLLSLVDASYMIDSAEKSKLRFYALQSLRLRQQEAGSQRQESLSSGQDMASLEKSLILGSEIFDNDFVVRSRRLIADNPIPEVVPEPPMHMVLSAISSTRLPLSSEDCVRWLKKVNIEQATSTWLSISAKGINIRDYINFDVSEPKTVQEPVCELDSYGFMWTMDHLQGYVMRDDNSLYKAERGLLQLFQNFSGKFDDSVDGIASKISLAMEASKNDYNKTWILATAAALYWRVVGNSSMAIQCLRHSILHAPYNMKVTSQCRLDLGLISLANVYHQNGWLHSALIAAGAAMRISPKFVVVHFTLANIYAALVSIQIETRLGNFDRAVGFYFSTLELQGSFEPAKERIRALFCTVGSEAAS
uniref:TPR_REGION domain-containing protein n=1 Tax=Soboliphyme baturini TaxID=241478 RepID=A0A183J5T8_9BILA